VTSSIANWQYPGASNVLGGGFTINPLTDEDGNYYAPHALRRWQLFVAQQIDLGAGQFKQRLWATNTTQEPVLVGEYPYTSSAYEFAHDGMFRIGIPGADTFPIFRGEIAEVFVASGNLSSVQMKRLARGEPVSSLSGVALKRYYRMLDAPTAGVDSSPNAGHGTVFGTLATTPHPIVHPTIAPNSTANWQMLIDWNRDRDTSDDEDDITRYVIDASWNVGFQEAGRDIAGDATATLTLNNSDRRFSPENVAGPYYGNDWLQRPLYIFANGVQLYSGWTTSIRPGFGNQTPTAVLTAKCTRQFWEQKSVEVQPLVSEIRSDEIVERLIEQMPIPWPTPTGPWVLDRVGFSDLDTSTRLGGAYFANMFDVGEETFPYIGDMWAPTLQVGSALQDIVSAERGKMLVSRRGQIMFWSRRRFINTVNVIADIDNTMQGCDYNWGDLLANEVSLTYSPRAVSDTFTTLWTLDSPVRVNVGEEKKISIRYGKEDADLIAALDVRIATFVVTPALQVGYHFEPGATSAHLTIKNTTLYNVQVTALTVEGRRVTGANSIEVVLKDGWSQFRSGVYAKHIFSQLLGSADRAELAARYEVVRFGEPLGNIRSVRLVSRDAGTLTAILNAEPGTRVRVTEAQTQHTGEYFVMGERHRLTAGMKLHEVTWTLEPCSPYTFWILGVAGSSETGVTTRPAPL